MTFSSYLAKGEGSWIFLSISIIFVALSIWEFFNGIKDFVLFIFGILFFFLAIRFCPCYAKKTCEIIGLRGR